MRVVDTLMHREGLGLNASDLLHMYCIVHLRRDPTSRMYTGNHYLRLGKPHQPQTKLVTDAPDKDMYLNEFIWVLESWKF